MVREIKFKAWTGEMMIDNPFHFEVNFQSDSKMFYRCYDTWQDYADGRSYPCEILQYSGLKDFYGKEIYEGDILSIRNGSINGYPWMEKVRAVKFERGAFNIPTWEPDSTHWIKIIGNIYQNRELI